MQRWLIVCFLGLLLIACSQQTNHAPVFDVNGNQIIPENHVHTVVHGDTLYKIAWQYGLDYRLLADINQLRSPYLLHSGQQILLSTSVKSFSTHEAINHEVVVREKGSRRLSSHEDKQARWIWPVKGKIINAFSPYNNGIDISGQLGQPVFASASGTVVYSGNGLRGYGNLIIVKHNSIYFSAYAHNKVMLVKEGEKVNRGQKIAEMGNTGSNRVMLHFEIRRAGKSINPLPLLGNI